MIISKVFVFSKLVRYVPVLSLFKYLNGSTMWKFKYILGGDTSETWMWPQGSRNLVETVKAFVDGRVVFYDRFTSKVVSFGGGVLENMVSNYLPKVRDVIEGVRVMPFVEPKMEAKIRPTKWGRAVELLPFSVMFAKRKMMFFPRRPDEYGDGVVVAFPMFVGYIINKKTGSKTRVYLALTEDEAWEVRRR